MKTSNNILYCDSRGDSRFSAFYAYVIIDGKNDSIESFYQNAKRDENGNIPGKGKPFSYFIWKGKKYKKEGISKLYENLWRLYFKQNPLLLQYACRFNVFIDRFRGKARNCQADVIEKLVKEHIENSIIIKNLRYETPTKPYQIKVDRSSILGNPYYMKDESMRDEVCDKYKTYFYHMILNEAEFDMEVKRLIEVYKEYNKLELFCWCAPKRCHAETIKEYIINIVYKKQIIIK